MTRHIWTEIKPLLDQALDLPVAERARFIEKQCEGDSELKKELFSYLAIESEVEELLEEPVLDILAGRSNEYRVGQRVGAYELESEMARGGMGVVYGAHRVEGGFEQQVAIKILKRGFDTGSFVRRFRTEQQVLAQLDHPHIARLFDGGATEDGLPYLVMERIDGRRLDDYCRQESLHIESRIELFSKICQAVHAAHQHMVVHCDLKPSNILVTAAGEPKLLDFGIAKVLSRDGGPVTRTHSIRLGTIPYASPEQLAGESIATSSDTYSLGAILFLLLTDQLPDSADPEEAPQVPSHRARSTVHGDLDAIVLKAMAFDPRDRYSSVAALGEDVHRHLQRLPVSAQPYTWRYALRLYYLRKKRRVWAMALLFFLTLSAGFYGLELHLEARLATARAADLRAAYLELIELFDPTADESPAAAAETAVESILASESLERLTAPERAEIFDRLGRLLQRLERLDEAQPLLERAFSLRRASGQELREEAMQSLNNIAVARMQREENKEAAILFELVLDQYRRHEEWGEGHRLDVLHNLATVKNRIGEPAAAETLLVEVLGKRRAFYGADSMEVAKTTLNLGNLYLQQHRLEQAAPLLLESLTLRERHYGEHHPKVALALLTLAQLRDAQELYDDAIEAGRRALTIRISYLGDDAASTARARNALAYSLLGRRSPADLLEARELLQRARVDHINAKGATNETTLIIERNLAAAWLGLDQLESAERLLRRLDSMAETRQAWRVADVRNVLGGVLTAQGRLDEAGRWLEGTREVIREQRGADSRYAREAEQRWRAWRRALDAS